MLNPMRWYMEILRGVVLKGVGAAELGRAIMGQTVLAVGFLWLARMRFQKTVG
jgi:ABC-2 type transport system permease protein